MPRPHTDVRGAVIQFAVAGLIALFVIGAIAFLALRSESTDEAIRDARNLTSFVAESVVEPALAEHPGVVDGDRKALAAFDARMGSLVDGDPIVRIKIWTASGRVVYSDAPGLTGKTYDLPEEERTALAGSEPLAEISDLSRAENELERPEGKLLEVYLPISAPDGQTLLFETYQRFSSISEGSSAVLRKFLPIFLLSLLVLAAVQAPLAWSMARRLREAQRERERLLVAAIHASDRERRRIASDVHDGPVQELAGLSFRLAGAADSPEAGESSALRQSLEDAARAVRNVMRQLRGLLIEIHPPNLHASGLEAALSDLLAPLSARGITTELDVDEDLPILRPNVEALLFRGAQEALRNVAEHSHARVVRLGVGLEADGARLEVNDDGRGFDPDERERRRRDGHVGLDLLRDLVDDAGGRMRIDSSPDRGTRLEIVVPM